MIMQPIAQLIISLHSNGSITVSGPIENKILCYGLLEVAKDVIRDHVPAAAGGLITATAGELQ